MGSVAKATTRVSARSASCETLRWQRAHRSNASQLQIQDARVQVLVSLMISSDPFLIRATLASQPIRLETPLPTVYDPHMLAPSHRQEGDGVSRGSVTRRKGPRRAGLIREDRAPAPKGKVGVNLHSNTARVRASRGCLAASPCLESVALNHAPLQMQPCCSARESRALRK